MALRRTLSKRIFNLKRETTTFLNQSLTSSETVTTNFVREYSAFSRAGKNGFFRRFLHRPATLPDFLSVPVGDKLRERLRSINIAGGDRIRLDGIVPPTAEEEMGTVTETEKQSEMYGFSVSDARKLLRISQMEKLKAILRQNPTNSIPHAEFVRICVDACSSNYSRGVEFAKMLDESGNVIVLGDIVFLRPDQVAKSIEMMISQSMTVANDPRRKELEEMEKKKALIDQTARSQVQKELYTGLGFMVLQTLGFMRLTFWELSWDVMEPICFFVASLHFVAGYAFFLRTSKEPSFEGYFQRRFRTKQEKLMKLHSFDINKYNDLCRLFYPDRNRCFNNSKWTVAFP
ncbi:Calcium uniporter protein, C-terminal [Dillenia turbinata]|uniref:Calcium uniporter protein, C-terminal n=1 Tax=Dillenia turbinata TaxID=194707 RepID=A0AAN8W3X3_9MAGN